MMVGSHDKLQSETGYIDARPHSPDRGNLYQRTAGPYIRVNRDRGVKATGPLTSAVLPEPDVSLRPWCKREAAQRPQRNRERAAFLFYQSTPWGVEAPSVVSRRGL